MIWEVVHWVVRSLLDGTATVILLWDPVLEAHKAITEKVIFILGGKKKKPITKDSAELESGNPRALGRQYTRHVDLQLKPLVLGLKHLWAFQCTLAVNPYVPAATLVQQETKVNETWLLAGGIKCLHYLRRGLPLYWGG